MTPKNIKNKKIRNSYAYFYYKTPSSFLFLLYFRYVLYNFKKLKLEMSSVINTVN